MSMADVYMDFFPFSGANSVLDPIFSGLAWAIIFGILASTVFTLLVIPVMYWLFYGDKPTTNRVTPPSDAA